MRKLRCIALLMGLGLMASQAVLAAPRVWFDQGHAQAFRIESSGELHLSSLAEVFSEAGWEVRAGNKPLTPQRLKGSQALVISGPFKPFAASEIEAVLDFVRSGGRLALMLHIGPPLAGLLGPLGVLHSNGAIQEQVNLIDGEPLNFKAQMEKPHPLSAGIDAFSVYGSWALLAEGGQTEVLARSSEQSWIDLNGNRQRDAADAQQSFAVVVHGRLGQGAYLVFGDDAIFQNRFLQGGNLALARNLASWMLAGPQGALAMHYQGDAHGR